MPVLRHGGLETNYQLVGPALSKDAPPVALIHGLGANLAFWYLGAVRHLGRERSLVLHDLRGHGASSMPAEGYRLDQMAEDFRLLLDALGIGRAHVVGHSHGARVALVFALRYPDRVESLTLADTQIRALQKPMRLKDWPHWPEWKADLMRRGVTSFPPEEAEIDFRLLADLGPRSASGPVGGPGAGMGAGPGAGLSAGPGAGLGAGPGAGLGQRAGAFQRRRRAAAMPGGEAPRRIDLRSRQMGARGAEQWQRLLETTRADEELHDESPIRPEALPGLTMPVLLMYGRMSHCLPTSEALEKAIPDSRRVLVPGAGHFFPVVKPQFFARALRMFLARVDSRAGRPVADAAAPVMRRAATSPAASPAAALAAPLAGPPPSLAAPDVALRVLDEVFAPDSRMAEMRQPEIRMGERPLEALLRRRG